MAVSKLKIDVSLSSLSSSLYCFLLSLVPCCCLCLTLTFFRSLCLALSSHFPSKGRIQMLSTSRLFYSRVRTSIVPDKFRYSNKLYALTMFQFFFQSPTCRISTQWIHIFAVTLLISKKNFPIIIYYSVDFS